MSSKIEVQRICEHCGKDFIAKTTKTRFCSHACSSANYKARVRTDKIENCNNAVRKVKAEDIEILKIKEFLSVPEASKLLGISRRTIYRMIEKRVLNVYKIATRTIVKRSELNNLLGHPLAKTEKEIKQEVPITEFYTVKEIEEKFFVKYRRLNDIINKNKIPKTMNNGKLYVSKKHIDRYFERNKKDVSEITEWYTVEEIQQKYDLSRDQIYGKVYDNRIPKQRVGKYVQISKLHFDELFKIEI